MITRTMKNVSRWLLFAGMALAACVGASGCSKGASAGGTPPENHRRAPEFTGIDAWLNSEPLTMAGLRGKVVLVEFWTYECINCIRTLPHVSRWYDTYKDQGLVVVGVHTPESEFEQSPSGLQAAIRKFGIEYPVAQDNRFATWKAYGNQFWPATYLIDRDGSIVRTHVGEGEYDETEATIRELLSRGTSQ